MKTSQDKDGYDVCVGVTRFLMAGIGIWPEDYGKRSVLAKSCVFFIPLSMICFVIVPQSLKLASAYQDLNHALEILCVAMMVHSICILKYLGVWWYQNDLQTLMLNIRNDWKISTAEEQKIMWRNAKISRTVATACISTTCADVVLLCISNLASVHLALKNLAENETYIRPFMLQADYYFDFTYESPGYEVLYFGQIVVSYIGCFLYSSYDGFFVFTILHYSGQMYNLQLQVGNLLELSRKKDSTFLERLKWAVERHRHLVRNTEIMEENFNKPFLMQIFVFSVLICLQGYQFISIIGDYSPEAMPILIFAITYIITTMLSLFMYCFTAEQLRTECENLHNAISKISWYELPPNESRLLMIFMIATKNPINITVGKFSSFSLQYYCTIVKTSAGYLSMLLAVKDRLQEN